MSAMAAMSDPSPPARSRPSRRKASPMQNGGGGGARYLDEWRADVNDQLDKRAANEQLTAVILERLSNRLDALEAEHSRRLDALEKAPGERERTVVSLGGLLGQYAYLLIAGVLLWLALAPHIGWH